MWNFQRPIFTQRPYQFTEISQRYFVSENRIANFPKFQKKVDWNFNQCFMQNTNFEFFTNITTQRFTLEGHFRCSHHFVTFCSQRVIIWDTELTRVHYFIICWGWFCLDWDLTDQGHLKSFEVIWGQSGQRKRKWNSESLKIQRV